MAKDTFRSDFRRSFLTGFAALFPTILTVVILVQLYKFVDSTIGQPVNAAIKAQFKSERGKRILIKYFGWDPKWLQNKEEFNKRLDERYPNYIGPIFGLGVAAIVVYFAGHLLNFFIGKKIFQLTDMLMTRFPVVKAIYPYAKQITEFFFSDKKVRFRTVVAIEYPRRGVYSLGYVTGAAPRAVTRSAGQPMLNVFIPSSPTPVTGYVVMVPESEVIYLDMTIDEAVRFTISGGVLVPLKEAPIQIPASLASITPPSQQQDEQQKPSQTPPGESAQPK